MREIKFRAMTTDWNGRTGEWDYFGIWGSCDINDYNPDTLGEFTGLKDKNGKEIWEGDIIKVWRSDSFRDYVNEVYFVDGGFFTEWYHPLEKKHKAITIYAWPVEVIGNIYENKELLK